jgi:hypothetical protein
LPKFITFGILFMFSLAITGAQTKQRLELTNEETLFCDSSSGRFLLKALHGDQSFQGFGIVNQNEIFLAYSSGEAEASSILSVYEIADKSEKVIIEIGGTGESNYSLNEDTGMIAFNWYNGIYIFSFTAL